MLSDGGVNTMQSEATQPEATPDPQRQRKSTLGEIVSQWSKVIQPEASLYTTDVTKPAGAATLRGFCSPTLRSIPTPVLPSGLQPLLTQVLPNETTTDRMVRADLQA